jgi:hypothetical protein
MPEIPLPYSTSKESPMEEIIQKTKLDPQKENIPTLTIGHFYFVRNRTFSFCLDIEICPYRLENPYGLYYWQ